tara:strand:- start:911 stop:1033 length:123 start_codon:yes stop_codon:yes gene_type:complete
MAVMILKKKITPAYHNAYNILKTKCPYLRDKTIEDIVPKK